MALKSNFPTKTVYQPIVLKKRTNPIQVARQLANNISLAINYPTLHREYWSIISLNSNRIFCQVTSRNKLSKLLNQIKSNLIVKFYKFTQNKFKMSRSQIKYLLRHPLMSKKSLKTKNTKMLCNKKKIILLKAPFLWTTIYQKWLTSMLSLTNRAVWYQNVVI